jgi:DNA-binding NarL/FixJ family response regulator
MNRAKAARQAFAVGAASFLVKPVLNEQLFTALRDAIERTRSWREQADDVSSPAQEVPPHLTVVATAGRPVLSDTVLPNMEVSPPLEAESPPSKLLAWPPLPTLRALDIDWCADNIAKLGGLTDRERNILVPLLRGEQNGEIAQATGASPRTVKFHVSNILKKLRITQRSELLRFFF